MMSANRVPTLLALASLSGVLGCYTVDFDETRPDVYYCSADDECLESQSCAQFRCVDDSGPNLSILLPEPLTPIEAGATTLAVNFVAGNLVLSDADAKVEGEGKVRLTIDPDRDTAISDLALQEGIQLSFPELSAGPHRLVAEAVYGDGSPYTNPSAVTHQVFFVEDPVPTRPQVALVEPRPGHVHVANEPLFVRIAARNFTFVENEQDCHAPDDCDPFAEPGCVSTDAGCTEVTRQGHTHVYLIENYPACLEDVPVGCNGKYIATIRPGEADSATDTEVSVTIPGDRFPDTGSFTLTAALQYNDHDPFPNAAFVIYDQIPLEIIER